MYNQPVQDLSIRLFGSPQIRRGNQQITIQRRKDLALLIYLVVTSQPHSRDTLATLLWQDHSQTDARSNLRKSLSRLKALLGDHSLLVKQEQVEINPEQSIDLDILQFQRRVQQFRKHGHTTSSPPPYLCAECKVALQEATALYQADFLEAFSLPDSPMFEEWQFFQGENLRQNLAETLETLVHHCIYTGETGTGIEYARRWLALDRLHEPAHRQLMILYAVNGQHAAAIRQFEECARLLDEELGAKPETETQNVYEAIRKKKVQELLEIPQHAREQEPGQEKPGSPSPGIAHNLPVHLTPFVARDKELMEIARLLHKPACHLLTLLGPGGSGKTRLAVQIASSLAEEMDGTFKDGVWFVPLAPLTDSRSIAGAILETMQISGFLKGADARQRILDHLHGRHILLVLDNFEHLLGTESIELISAIASSAPHGRILITSRERLGITGEYVFPVEGLEIPAEAAPLSQPDSAGVIPMAGALRLFEQSAQRIQPSFRITTQNYRRVTRICQLVEGMPLAIELAASWLQVFSLEDISGEIERSLDFLESNWRDLPDRQRSLRAVFESSWTLLDRRTRPILKALSVFRSSFTREAAQAIAGASAKALLDLTNKSWIQRLPDGRYQIHELLRQYAFEKLQKEHVSFDHVKKQYCEYYADLSFSLWQMLKGAKQAPVFTEAENEFENMRTAWMLLLSSNGLEVAVEKMLPLLFQYSELHGRVPELRGLMEAGLEAVETQAADSQRKMEIILRTAQGAFYKDGFPVRFSVNEAIFPINLANIQQAWSLSQEQVRFEELGFWGILLAFLYGRLIRLEDGIAKLEELLSTFQGESAYWELANVYLHLIRLLNVGKMDQPGQQEMVMGYLSRALDLFTSLGDRINIAHSLSQWGEFKFHQQDLEGAIQQMEAAHSIFLSLNEWSMAIEMLWPISELYLQSGFFQKSFDSFREIANTYLEHGLVQQAVSALSKESFEKVRYGDLSEALNIRQQCLALILETGIEYQFAWNYWEMGEIMRVSGDLAEASAWFDRSLSIFEKFSDHVGRSFYYRGLGEIALARQDHQSAKDHFSTSAQLALTAMHTWSLIYALNGLGRSELALHDLESARRHLKEALELSGRIKDKGITLVVLAGLAELFASRGKSERAVELSTLVQTHPVSWNETKQQVSVLLSSLKKSLATIKYKQAQKRGESTDLWTIVNQVLTGLSEEVQAIATTPPPKTTRRKISSS